MFVTCRDDLIWIMKTILKTRAKKTSGRMEFLMNKAKAVI